MSTLIPASARRFLISAWIAVLAVYLFHLMYWPPIEVRVSSFICILTGLYSPVLSLYAIALFGALYLENPGANYNLSHLECLVASALLHQAFNALRSSNEELKPSSQNAQFFLICGISTLVLLLASSITGIIQYIQELQYLPAVPRWAYLIGTPAWGRATESAWTPKSLFNWTLGFAAASIAYQHANNWVISRFYKFASAGVVFVCVLGVFDYLLYPNGRGYLLMQLKETFSTANPDPLHYGRFSATATHAGWLGQWIVLTFPGFLVWFRTSGSPRKNIIFGAAAGFVFVCFMLTLARAPWLGLIVSTGVVGILMAKRLTLPKPKTISVFAAAILGCALVALAVVPGLFVRRIETLFQVSDRLNYVFSSLDLLYKYPLGIGLGTHFPLYSEFFLPPYRYYQRDHVEIHNTLFHLITENSLLILIPLLGGLGALLAMAKKSLHQLEPHEEIPFHALLASLVGILVIGIAQYIFYIRSVELFVWVALGFSAGLLGRYVTVPRKLLALKWPLLGVCVVGALAITAAHLSRAPWKIDPRYTEFNEETETYQKWIKNETQLAVDSSVTAFEFSLYELEDVGKITLTWPDGEKEVVELQPNETRFFERTLSPPENSFPSRWFKIECERTWRPVDYIEGSKDYRELGVFMSGIKFVKADSVAE